MNVARFLRRLTAALPLPLVIASCSLTPGGSVPMSLDLQGIAPAGITSQVVVSVVGPGMASITEAVAPGVSSVELVVLAGPDRTIAVEWDTDFGTVGDSVTQDVFGGRQEISLYPTIQEPRYYIVPDSENGRLALFVDLNGNGWLELDTNMLTVVATFTPEDAEVDEQGNHLYIANGDPTDDYIIRVSNESGANEEVVIDDPDGTGVDSIAIDSQRDRLYWASKGSNALKRATMDGNNPDSQTLPGVNEIIGLSVHHASGRVLVLYTTPGGGECGTYQVGAWDPEDAAFRGTIEVGWSQCGADIGDVHAIGDAVYAGFEHYSPPTAKVVQLSYSAAGQSFASVDEFTGLDGPIRFIAHQRTDGITFVDASGSACLARVVRMKNASGAGFATYGSWGSTQDRFRPVPGCV